MWQGINDMHDFKHALPASWIAWLWGGSGGRRQFPRVLHPSLRSSGPACSAGSSLKHESKH